MRNIEHLRQVNIARPLIVQAAYFQHLFLCQNGSRAMMICAANTPAFGPHVEHVFGVRSWSQMARVDAWRVVARVHDYASRGRRSIFKLPCDPGGPDIPPVKPKHAVSILIAPANPEPAFRVARFINFFVKSYGKRLLFGHTPFCMITVVQSIKFWR